MPVGEDAGLFLYLACCCVLTKRKKESISCCGTYCRPQVKEKADNSTTTWLLLALDGLSQEMLSSLRRCSACTCRNRSLRCTCNLFRRLRDPLQALSLSHLGLISCPCGPRLKRKREVLRLPSRRTAAAAHKDFSCLQGNFPFLKSP